MMTSTELMLSASRPAQLADYPAGAIYGPRKLPDFELVWLLTGSARLTVRPNSQHGSAYDCTLHPGDLALVRRGEHDHYAWDPRVPSRHAYVHFEVHNMGNLPETGTWQRVRRSSEFPVLESLCD